RAWIPSNSLSSVYGVALEASSGLALGEDVEIVIEVYDESNFVIPIKQINRRIAENDLQGLVCLVGVQSNQFPRAVDLARQFRAAGVQVAIGGFHVSGSLAMLPELTGDLREALDMGITLFAGEVEGRLEQLLKAAQERRLEPVYNFMSDLPAMQGQPIPFLPKRVVTRYFRDLGCFDAGRGCPFTCSFCTIINVQGRKSRYRTADDVERLLRANAAQGVHRYFITDDNFARNRNWEAIFDRIIELRENEGLQTNFVMQVDTMCHKIPHFVEKAARAGCKRVFLGLESINPDSLKGASKNQNRITEYRTMLLAWRRAGIITYAGYIIGFPADTAQSIERDIRIMQRELPIDMLEFFMLTPLPGSQDHKEQYLKGSWMDPDLNKYDLEHVTTEHPLMTKEEWQGIYDRAWRMYYTWEHMETLLKRAAATGISPSRLADMLFQFYGSFVYERLHPLQTGLIRRKVRTQRRHGLPLINPLRFYPARVWEILTTYIPGLLFRLKLGRLCKRIKRDPRAQLYSDIAISPVQDSQDDDLQIYQNTEAARAALAHVKQKSAKSRAISKPVPARASVD
ncbi:MAG: radical SAM protein, partial [Deltaproteobacteria bacterium]|nr:radical SAM protein [Deltaproteobacteria bacterium]